MEKKSKDGTSDLGSEEPVKVFSEADFKKMVSMDLQTAISFLLAINNDPNVQQAVTDHMYGRYLNHLHKKELDAQTKIPV